MNTKGLIRTRNFFYLLSIAFILASVVTGFMPPRIALATATWTTNGSSCTDPAAQDTNQYDAGDHVYIRGNGFTPDTAGTYTITGQPGGASNDPNQVVASGGFTTDSTGYFCVDAYVVGSEGADDGYVDDGTYKYEVTVGRDTKFDNYTTDAPNPASASVTTGACTYTPAAGSLTLVTINLTGASLTIAGLTYTSSTVINLPPGSYPYTWTALEGYAGSGSGTLVVQTCAPGSATVTLGSCSYSQAEGSKTAVIIDVSNAALTIAGNTYTTDQTIYLSPGSYPYTWVGIAPYTGSGGGTLTVGHCDPGSASVTLGACTYSAASGSTTAVNINVSHATLTIAGTGYTSSTTIYLAPGSYPYSWTAVAPWTGSGSGTLVVGHCDPGSASVTLGACSYTPAIGSTTEVNITVSHASLTIAGGTYTSSQTINLAQGSYPYTWTAQSPWTGSGSGTLVVGHCDPGSASVTLGACSYTPSGGSSTEVNITVDHAILTIASVAYSSSTTINLAPGSYPYTWSAVSPWTGSGSGTLVVGHCDPGSASVTLGACSFDEATGSSTEVNININNASLTIAGNPYTSSTTIYLAPGSYPYTWTAISPYTGSGGGTLVVDQCAPGNASLSIGACSYEEGTGSSTEVNVSVENSTLTIDGTTYNVSQTIYLEPGSYPYTWTAISPYTGGGSGTLVVGHCDPGDASVSLGACSYIAGVGSSTTVSVFVENATLNIGGFSYSSSTTIYLAPGSYPYTWTAASPWTGSGSGTLVVGHCDPGSGGVTLGACTYTAGVGSSTEVNIVVSHATLTIDGNTYNASQIINLPPGSYPYTWSAVAPWTGSGSGTLVVDLCDPANASVTLGACTYQDGIGSSTEINLTVDHAILTIDGTTYATSQAIQLPPGSYPYTWTAIAPYTGSGAATLEVSHCDPGTASVTLGACTYEDSVGSMTSVNINVNNATLTIDGVIYTVSTTVDLAPGSYPYSWEAVTPYTGSGSGTLVVDVCDPGSASVNLGACTYSEAVGSSTNVNIVVDHAVMTFDGVEYISNQVLNLEPGNYEYSWIAVAPYTGAGNGILEVKECVTLELDGICAADPENFHGWKATNRNTYPVEAEWRVNGSTLAGLLSIPADSVAFFTSPRSEGNIMMLFLGGNFQDDASAMTDCETPDTPPETPPETPPLIPVTAAEPVLIPVTGVAKPISILPVGLYSLALCFFGFGTIFHGLSRRRKIK